MAKYGNFWKVDICQKGSESFSHCYLLNCVSWWITPYRNICHRCLTAGTSFMPLVHGLRFHANHSRVNLQVQYNHFHSTENRLASEQDEQFRSQKSYSGISFQQEHSLTDVSLFDLLPYGKKSLHTNACRSQLDEVRC